MKLTTAVSGFLAATCLACGDGTESVSRPGAPVEPVPGLPPVRVGLGDISVSTRTSGADLDSDGFKIQVDGYWDYTHPVTPIAPTGTALLRGIPSGPHTLTLYELAPNCSGENLADRAVVVRADSVVAVEFDITCKVISR